MKIDYDGIMIIDHWTTSFGEMTLSNYDSNENADYEPSESEDSDEQTHPDTGWSNKTVTCNISLTESKN